MKSKIILALLIVLCIMQYIFIVPVSNASLGVDADGKQTVPPSSSFDKKASSGGFFGGANSFIEDGENQVNGTLDEQELKETSNYIYNIVLGIAIVIAVAVGAFLGIKFMISSVDEQAKIKELLVPYVAGCIVVFGAFGIWKIAVEVFKVF